MCCIYRLDEPNAGDTFYALQVLSLLGQELHDDETVSFLLGLQKPDGSYSSYSAALFAGRGLRLLNRDSHVNPGKFLSRSIPLPDQNTHVIEAVSLFDPLLTWLSLHALHRIPLSGAAHRQATESVLRYHTPTGGFGSPVATLPDTWQASEILTLLNHPLKSADLTGFIRSCEDPCYGYLGRPGAWPPYLEHLYAGVRLSSLLGTAPRYTGACRAFLERCAHHTGGYTRSVFGGTPTLEFTVMAVESRAILAAGKSVRYRSLNTLEQT